MTESQMINSGQIKRKKKHLMGMEFPVAYCNNSRGKFSLMSVFIFCSNSISTTFSRRTDAMSCFHGRAFGVVLYWRNLLRMEKEQIHI